MTLPKMKNNAQTTLNGSHSSGSSSLTVVSGAALPAITGSEYFYATVWDQASYAMPSDDANMEVVKVTAVSTNILTLAANTTHSHASGDTVAILLTEEFFEDLEASLAVIDGGSP